MPKVYDCFTFFNELNILEIRLTEMSPYVDKFVLVEATQTFQGKPKPLYFQENKARFSRFLDKIEHVVVDFPPDLHNQFSKKSEHWAREYYQRDQIGRGLSGAAPDDLIIVSDVDEIIDPAVLERELKSPARGTLRIFTMPLFSYFLNRKVVDSYWALGPRMVEYRYFTSGQKLRMTKLHGCKIGKGSILNNLHTRIKNYWRCGIHLPVREISSAGWHFTSIGGWQELRTKIEAYSHNERMDTPQYKSEADFYAHMNQSSVCVDMDLLPVCVKKNPDTYKHMLDLAKASG